MALHDHPRSLILSEIESAYGIYLLIMNNNHIVVS